VNGKQYDGASKKSIKWQIPAFFLVLGLVIALGMSQPALSQKKQKARTNRKAAQQEAVIKEKQLSAWNIIEMTDWLFWPFVLLTAAGVILITYRGLAEYREKLRAKPILGQKIQTGDVRRLVKVVQTSQPNRASKLMHQMIVTFQKTNRAEPISNDIEQYLAAERGSFETFNRVLGFFSDTAGALGLLGTVWGIFMTFHAGKMDGPTILQGMSISLVTTLVGLIISLVLNMGTTSIFAFFNRQLQTLGMRAEEMRQVLLTLEAKALAAKQKVPGNGASTAPAASDLRPRASEPAAAAETSRRRSPEGYSVPTEPIVVDVDQGNYL